MAIAIALLLTLGSVASGEQRNDGSDLTPGHTNQSQLAGEGRATRDYVAGIIDSFGPSTADLELLAKFQAPFGVDLTSENALPQLRPHEKEMLYLRHGERVFHSFAVMIKEGDPRFPDARNLYTHAYREGFRYHKKIRGRWYYGADFFFDAKNRLCTSNLLSNRPAIEKSVYNMLVIAGKRGVVIIYLNVDGPDAIRWGITKDTWSRDWDRKEFN